MIEQEFESDRDFQFLPNFRSVEGSLCLHRKSDGYEYLPACCNRSRDHEGSHESRHQIWGLGIIETWGEVA